MMATDTERARAALQAIPPDCDRDTWVRAGMAAHAAGLDFDAFDSWSAQAGNYDARAARDTWRSFKPGKGVGAGTLHRMAAEHGHQQESPASRLNGPW
ncbi:MAG: PriCT-2 domain-containing protein [Burkholderiaceae bacterium]